jgi:hypothetical protein
VLELAGLAVLHGTPELQDLFLGLVIEARKEIGNRDASDRLESERGLQVRQAPRAALRGVLP